MVVTVRFDPAHNGWQVYWRCHGKQMLRVPCNALRGDKGAAERVAHRLRAHVEQAADRSDREVFVALIDDCNAEELRRTEEEPAGAAPPGTSAKMRRMRGQQSPDVGDDGRVANGGTVERRSGDWHIISGGQADEARTIFDDLSPLAVPHLLAHGIVMKESFTASFRPTMVL